MKHPKFNIEMKSFWDSFEGRYQMGEQKHRTYMLDLLKEKGVNSLLDDGCGTAPIYEMIKDTNIETQDGLAVMPRWSFKYKGTDYSPAMVEICKQEFPEGDFEVEDARNLTEEDSTWDCVLLMHAIDHLDDYKAAIKEAARVSKKYVCIILWRGFVAEGTNLNDRNTMGKEEGEAPWQDTYLQEYSKESLDEAFKEAGLVIEQTAEGEALNSDHSHYNFLYLLRKENSDN